MVGARKGPRRSLGFAFGYGCSQLRANNLFGGREHGPLTQRSAIGAACVFTATSTQPPLENGTPFAAARTAPAKRPAPEALK